MFISIQADGIMFEQMHGEKLGIYIYGLFHDLGCVCLLGCDHMNKFTDSELKVLTLIFASF